MLFIVAVAHGFVAGQTPIPLPLLPPTTPQGMEGGFWRTDGNFDPILHLKNVLLKQSLDVSPSIIFADGTELALPLVHLEAAGVASVDLKIAIQSAPHSIQAHVSTYGMAAISYQWSWAAVVASIQDTDEIASLSNANSTLATISVVHQATDDPTARRVQGTWWKPTKDSEYVLALGNTSLTNRRATVVVSDHLGNPAAQRSVALPSHNTVVFRLGDLLNGALPGETAGGVSIFYTGPRFGIVASAGIEDPSIGYSVTPQRSPPQRSPWTRLV